jgi:predicted RNase H-like nuclease (RuvC/YqgF family)
MDLKKKIKKINPSPTLYVLKKSYHAVKEKWLRSCRRVEILEREITLLKQELQQLETEHNKLQYQQQQKSYKKNKIQYELHTIADLEQAKVLQSSYYDPNYTYEIEISDDTYKLIKKLKEC